MKKQSIFLLVLFIFVAEAAGFFGAFFIGSIDSWYATLHRPWFSPPNWLFGPVWTVLYALMGIAAYLVWQEGRRAKKALKLYWTQLAVNAAWTPLFFGLHNPALALADIVLLFILVAITVFAFARVRHTAAFLLLPYLVWTSFATMLNFAIWYLN